MFPKKIAYIVGIFIIVAALGLVSLAVKVSGVRLHSGKDYQVAVMFNNIGNLKVGAPVKVAGVRVGDVATIQLEPKTFEAKVVLNISDTVNNLPVDSSASIFTQGLLGANYVDIEPGFKTESLKNNDTIATAHGAVILEKLIGQLVYGTKK